MNNPLTPELLALMQADQETANQLRDKLRAAGLMILVAGPDNSVRAITAGNAEAMRSIAGKMFRVHQDLLAILDAGQAAVDAAKRETNFPA